MKQAYNRAYSLANKEKIAAQKKVYYKANREKIVKQKRGYMRNNRKQWKAFLVDKGYNICVHCGYSKCFAAIDFHHVDPKAKEHHIAYLISTKSFTEKNKSLLLRELIKCLALCANCHRELHIGE